MFRLNVAFITVAAVVAVKAQTPPFSGQAQIHLNLDNNYCLTAEGNQNGDIVDIQPCDSGNANQDWTFSGGQVQLFGGNKCLDVTNGVNQDGTLLQIWDCVSYNTNQQWWYTGDNR